MLSESAFIHMNGELYVTLVSHFFHLRIFWLSWDLNLGLPIEKPALYPLLHKLTLKGCDGFSFRLMQIFLLPHLTQKITLVLKVIKMDSK
jgi:hypothetical protein